MAYLWKTHLSEEMGAPLLTETHYHHKARAEILPFITWSPSKVLDIGCASGVTGEILLGRFPGCQMYGMEINPEAAKHAADIYSHVVVGNVEHLDLEAVDLPFADIDTVLVLDILEHLYNPWQFLSKLHKYLQPHCRVVASIPNSFNIQLLEELANGQWTYTQDGLLDVTHIRFFCEENMHRLFTESGYRILGVGNVPHPQSRLPYPVYREADHVETAHVTVKNLDAKSSLDLFAIQKIVVASAGTEFSYEAPDISFDLDNRVAKTPSPTQELRNSYLDMVRGSVLGLIHEDPALNPKDHSLNPFSREAREYGRDWPSLAHSMIGQKRMLNVQQLAEDALIQGIPGDFIETGVWRGGTCIMLRAVLKAYAVTDRMVWVADSFAGLPEPSPESYPQDAGDAHHTFAELAVPLEQVQRNFAKYGLLDEQVKFLKGWFKDTLPHAPIDKLALMRLDGDMYESTMDALVNLFPKLSPGGFVIVDDYGYIDSCRNAVDEFRARHGIQDPIQQIDQFGIYWQNLLPHNFSNGADSAGTPATAADTPSVHSSAAANPRRREVAQQPMDAQSLVRAGQNAWKNQDTANALGYFWKAFHADQSSTMAAISLVALSLCMLAAREQRAGNSPGQLAALEAFLRLQPNNAWALPQVIELLMKKGDRKTLARMHADSSGWPQDLALKVAEFIAAK